MSAIVQALPPETLRRRIGHRLRDWAPAALVLVMALVAWEVLVRALGIQRFLLPKPSEILDALVRDRKLLVDAGLFTFREALGGFAMGTLAGVGLALVLARWRRLGSALMPYAIAANAVPIIAFAPIMNNWFGTLNPVSKMAIVAVIVVFPVMINTLRGLTSVRPEQIELMRSYAAGQRAIFRRVRIPTALPYLFSALKVASVLSMIGAVVGEYFGGSTTALGPIIRNSASLFVFDRAWAAIVVASVLGVAFYLAIVVAERFAMRWHPSVRGHT
ncbi:MAG: ABC transporter permease [Actinobacteria bacterium]|nr:ABC transporter permease [Actinomycetota bacterium]